jgi:hypothetical protein
MTAAKQINVPNTNKSQYFTRTSVRIEIDTFALNKQD